MSTEKGKQKNSGSINISWWTTKLDLPHDFRRHIRRSPAENLDLLFIRDAGGEAKINELDLIPLVKHNVFEFDVSVSYAFSVEILQSIDKLAKYLSGVIFTHSSVWFTLQEAMSRTAGHIFEDQNNLFFSLNGFIESGDVRMVQPLHESDFSSDRFLPLYVLNLLFFIYL